MPVTMLTDLNQMTTEDIVMALSNVVTSAAFMRDFPEEIETLRKLTDELERRLVLDKYITD